MKCDYPWILTDRQRCDVELLLTGAFAPLEGFMTEKEYRSVLEDMILPSGALWPIPITLDISRELAGKLQAGDILHLLREDNSPVAQIKVTDVYPSDLPREMQQIYGTDHQDHAGVAILAERHPFYVGGTVSETNPTVSEMARHVDFLPPYRKPGELMERWKQIGKPVIAFQTRNPMHGAHQALTMAALREVGDSHLLLHPVIGPTNPGDVRAAQRIRAILALAKTYPLDSGGLPVVTVASLPLAMRMAGPREALWHAIIRQNFGAQYFIVGRAPADPGRNPARSDGYWWPPFEAQRLFREVSRQLTIQPLFYPEYAWHQSHREFLPYHDGDQSGRFIRLSGSRVRQQLQRQEALPEWYAPQPVRDILQAGALPQERRGLVILFTGLSASGKSTLAKALSNVLSIQDARPVTLLDGDVVRRYLSKGLGFSPEDRHQHLERVAFVAQLISRHGGIALVSLIAPYEADRRLFRNMIKKDGTFVEVYMSAPLNVCEQRDPKGLYAQARAGQVRQMTGLDVPYEAPKNPDVVIDTSAASVDMAMRHLVGYLEQHQLVTVENLEPLFAPIIP